MWEACAGISLLVRPGMADGSQGCRLYPYFILQDGVTYQNRNRDCLCYRSAEAERPERLPTYTSTIDLESIHDRYLGIAVKFHSLSCPPSPPTNHVRPPRHATLNGRVEHVASKQDQALFDLFLPFSPCAVLTKVTRRSPPPCAPFRPLGEKQLAELGDADLRSVSFLLECG